MLLLASGVGMGASEDGAVVSSVGRLLMLGVGRMWWIPFLLITGACHG